MTLHLLASGASPTKNAAGGNMLGRVYRRAPKMTQGEMRDKIVRAFPASAPTLEWVKSVRNKWRTSRAALTLKRYKNVERLISSGLFNEQWYAAAYPDIAQVGCNLLDHYLRHGWREARNPSSLFHTGWYLNEYPDVVAAQICPLYHYLEFGVQEDRLANALFSARWYLERYPEVIGHKLHPLAHYEQLGTSGGYNPHPYFDTKWLSTQDAVLKSNHPNALAAYFAGELDRSRLTPELDALWYTESVAGIARKSPHVPCDFASRRPWEHAEQNRAQRVSNQRQRAKNLGIFRPSATADARAPGELHITIGIVGYNNSAAMLSRCFNSCHVALAQAGLESQSQIVYVENGTSQPARGLDPLVDILPSCGNLGFGAGHNYILSKSFEFSQSSHYLALNPDAVLGPDCIAALLDMSAVTDHTTLLEGLQFPDEHPKIYDMVDFDTPWASGACLLIPRCIYDALGGFDPNFFMYCEDVDLSWRARSAGFTVKTCPRALVYHATGHRRHCPREHKQFLTSGYVLAKKWGDQSFMKMLQEAYEHHYPNETQTWAQSEETCDAPKSHVADFKHMFHFAEVRW